MLYLSVMFKEKVNILDDNVVVKVLKETTKMLDKAEVRPQQVEATTAINDSLNSNVPLLLEAGTGTGKTLAYLIPVIVSGKKTIVSTATKQLSEQIINKDVPFLKKVLPDTSSPVKDFKAALLKGRDNYFCWFKDAENAKLGSELDIFDSAPKNRVGKEIESLKTWADKTKTGDRAEAPAVSDIVWRQYSSNSVECVGKNICPFASECFAEIAKDKARAADIVVTNHAVVANDLISETSSLGEREVVVFDELHEVDKYMTDAWGATLSYGLLKDAAKALRPVEDMVGLPVDEFSVSVALNKNAEIMKEALKTVEQGRISNPTGALAALIGEIRIKTFEAVSAISGKLSDGTTSEELKQNLSTVKKKLDLILEAADLITDNSPKTVKWISVNKSKDGSETAQLQAAPMYAGAKLQQLLNDKNMLMVGVSATIRVGGSFTIPKHNLGYTNSSNVKTLAVDSPFDYKKQAMLYIPDDSFPSPVWKEREEHGEAVKAVSHQLVQAMNGRAVILTTTTNNITEIGEYLRKKNPSLNIILQGDAPNSQIVEQFKADEHSVLVGTMGLWHGLDLPGQTASLLIIDKIPFKHKSDPLLEARSEYVESQGRDGFTDVFVSDASIMLTQGFGRLIRTSSDKGIVAILDKRLVTHKYGEILRKSLPNVSVFRNREKVVAAAERLAKILDS